MPDHTVTSAAIYLKERGYTVSRGRIGGRGAPRADTIRRWCERGKIEARQVGRIWLIAEEALDDLLKKAVAGSSSHFSGHFGDAPDDPTRDIPGGADQT